MIEIDHICRLLELQFYVSCNLDQWRLDQNVRDRRMMTRLLHVNAENILIISLVTWQLPLNIGPVCAHERLESLS